MLGHRRLSAAEYLGIWRRRGKWAPVCCLAGAAAGYGLARGLPARYTSTATVDAALGAASAVISAPDLPAMQERVLTRERLQGLVEQFALYSYESSMENRVTEMRRNVVLAPAGQSRASFTISFTAGKAEAAQQICGEVVSLFRSDAAEPAQKAAGVRAGSMAGPASAAMDSLAKQAEEARRSRDDADARLAAFRRRHAADLPDAGATESRLATLKAQLASTNAELKRVLPERATLTESLLAQRPATAPERKVDSARVQALEQQLATEQAQLVTLQARYTSDYPDVVKLKSDIEQLQEKIEQARQAEAQGGTTNSEGSMASEPPQAAALRARIHELDLIVQEKTREQGRLQEEIQAAQIRLDNAAVLQHEYEELKRESERAKSGYDQALARQNDARKTAETEARQMPQAAFQVTLPPSLPTRPSFPNPMVFTLGGAGSGLALGLLVMLVGEMRDKTLRTEGDIEHFLALPTLAVIPADAAYGGNQRNGSSGIRSGSGASGEKEQGVLTDA